MITNESAKSLPIANLLFARSDLHQVIEIQERNEMNAPGSCPKLGAYWDELHAVAGEIKRRIELARISVAEEQASNV